MERNSPGSSESPVRLLVARFSTWSSAGSAASGSEAGVEAILGAGVREFPDHGNMWGEGWSVSTQAQLEMKVNVNAKGIIQGQMSPDRCTRGAAAPSTLRDSRGFPRRGLKSSWRSW